MTNRHSEWKQEPDYYGVLSDAKELDSDVNEDRGREKQLDASLQHFLKDVEDVVRRKHDMTNVPEDSVFEAPEMAGQSDDDERV